MNSQQRRKQRKQNNLLNESRRVLKAGEVLLSQKQNAEQQLAEAKSKIIELSTKLQVAHRALTLSGNICTNLEKQRDDARKRSRDMYDQLVCLKIEQDKVNDKLRKAEQLLVQERQAIVKRNSIIAELDGEIISLKEKHPVDKLTKENSKLRRRLKQRQDEINELQRKLNAGVKAIKYL